MEEKTVVVNVKVPLDVEQFFSGRAKATFSSRSACITRALVEYVRGVDPVVEALREVESGKRAKR